MTLKLADHPAPLSGPPTVGFASDESLVGPYRAAVSELVTELGQFAGADRLSAERIFAKRLDESQFAAVLSATPDGRDATIARLLFDVRHYARGPRSPASLVGLVRISMLTQIEAVWWGRADSYETDAELLDSADLVDLDELSESEPLNFCYRHQAATLLSRAARSAERRTLPHRTPRTAGLHLAVTRPPVIGWLNDLADDFAKQAPPGTAPLWVTSLARSAEHQRRLKELGYLAPLPSSHCVGYGADIEVAWYRRFHAHRILRGLLLDRQRAGEVNVIDEGQAWHVCLRPGPGLACLPATRDSALGWPHYSAPVRVSYSAV